MKHLEPVAEEILEEIRQAVSAGDVTPKAGCPSDHEVHMFSAAVSLKRIADGLGELLWFLERHSWEGAISTRDVGRR